MMELPITEMGKSQFGGDHEFSFELDKLEIYIRYLEKEMATHSSILAWKNPWMEEPGRLQSMGSQRVGHD